MSGASTAVLTVETASVVEALLVGRACLPDSRRAGGFVEAVVVFGLRYTAAEPGPDHLGLATVHWDLVLLKMSVRRGGFVVTSVGLVRAGSVKAYRMNLVVLASVVALQSGMEWW